MRMKMRVTEVHGVYGVRGVRVTLGTIEGGAAGAGITGSAVLCATEGAIEQLQLGAVVNVEVTPVRKEESDAGVRE
jgi:hypothetical protein